MRQVITDDMSLENAIFEAKADLLDRIGTDDEVNSEGPEIRVDKDGYHYSWYANTNSAKKNEWMLECRLIAKLERRRGKVKIKILT
jgi:hypothetical protein